MSLRLHCQRSFRLPCGLAMLTDHSILKNSDYSVQYEKILIKKALTNVAIAPSSVLLPLTLRSGHADRPQGASVGWKTGFEPATSGTTIQRSNQLSYNHHFIWYSMALIHPT